MSSIDPRVWLCGNCGNRKEVCCCDAPKEFSLERLARNAIGRSVHSDQYGAYKRAVADPAVVLSAIAAEGKTP